MAVVGGKLWTKVSRIRWHGAVKQAKLALMQTTAAPDNSREGSTSSENRPAITEPNFGGQPKPISEFAGRADFPQCVHGEFVDIGGYAGVVIEITRQSIRVKSPENITQGFNVHVLRRLYGPRPEPEPLSVPIETAAAPSPRAEAEPSAAPPKKQVVTNPDFTKSPMPISRFAGRHDFPQCALGELVDIAGFQGVIVEITAESVKVTSQQGIIRSYGVKTLRTLYGRA